ncbi:hypothetical protein UlMin_031006 [Ulmus minor]
MISSSGQPSLSFPHPWNHRNRHRPPSQQPSTLVLQCALTKQGHRFLSTLTVKAGDPSATAKLIGKFVGSTPKSISLNALSHLLAPDTTHPHLTPLAFPLYSRIKEESWFDFNTKLVADLAALLDKQGKHRESEALISETSAKLGNRQREISIFYCNLLESCSKRSSKHGFDSSYSYLCQLLENSSSVYVKRRVFESVVGGLCTMDRPGEAESLIEEMKDKGLKPSVFEFRSVMYSYGRLGLLEDMIRIANQMESEGLEIDTVSSNMILSSYGVNRDLPQMVLWLRKMKASGIPFSIRTYNTVLNSCPTIMQRLQSLNEIPLSMELNETLSGEEAQLVSELVGSKVLEEVMVWDSSQAKLDLHGMHLGSAYVIMLEWMLELQNRFSNGKHGVPAEVVVVCGSGKHSNVRGVSPVKVLIKEMMIRTGSPLKIDRKNAGCFVAKGKTVKDWLCHLQLT